MSWPFWVHLFDIALIDIALSGDNAIVIGMAAAALPAPRRRWAILLGGAGAIVLRLALTAVATYLLRVPYLTAAGGAVLVWVVWRLLRGDDPAEPEPDREAGTFRQAILLIVVADFMMSLDNVIAVAGAARGSVGLLAAGLLLSMPLLLLTGGFVSALIDRARWLVYLGAGAISFTAARMMLEDQAVGPRLHVSGGATLACSLGASLGVPAACWALNARRPVPGPEGGGGAPG